jgi:hypothetical protein
MTPEMEDANRSLESRVCRVSSEARLEILYAYVCVAFRGLEDSFLTSLRPSFGIKEFRA